MAGRTEPPAAWSGDDCRRFSGAGSGRRSIGWTKILCRIDRGWRLGHRFGFRWRSNRCRRRSDFRRLGYGLRLGFNYGLRINKRRICWFWFGFGFGLTLGFGG
jgi:hypothetical protein